MISDDELNAIAERYVELLILQYSDKPKAQQQIRDYAKGLLADGIIFDIRDGFDIDTAVGAQLDILGKYIGVNRNGSQLIIDFDQNLFSAVEDASGVIPAAFGAVTEANFSLVDSHVLGAEEGDIVSTQVLNDETYRFILKLKIIQNNINHSEFEIDEAVNDTFEGKLIPSGSDGMMTMTYIAEEDILTNAEIAFKKGVLPKPMAVGLPFIVKKPVDENLFGFAFGGQSPDFVSGFTIDGNEGGKALFQEDLIFN